MSHSLLFPNEAPDYRPAIGELVRVLADPERGKFGTVITYVADKKYPYEVKVNADTRVWLAPNEMIKA